MGGVTNLSIRLAKAFRHLCMGFDCKEALQQCACQCCVPSTHPSVNSVMETQGDVLEALVTSGPSYQLLYRRAVRLPLGAGCACLSGRYLTLVCLFQTDGASAVLLMSEEKALALGYKPKAYLR